MAGIFICYRREDSAGWAGRLAADLVTGLPGVRIFRDVDAIPPGVNFDEYITQAIGSCEVFITLIGPHWLTLSDANGKRRLDDPEDFIRLEISTSLKRDIRIIPTLIGGAAVPKTADLPEDLRPLARRQFYEIDDHRWADDCRKLIADLRPLVRPERRPRYRVAAALLAAVVAGASVLWWSRSETVGNNPIDSVARERQAADGSAQRRDMAASAAGSSTRSTSGNANVGMMLEVSGSRGTARVGDASVSEYNRASILVVAQNRQTGAPIVTLAPQEHTGTEKSIMPLPTGWNLDVKMVPPGGCSLEPTHVYNDGSGGYTLSIMTFARDGPCPWLKGEYQFMLSINVNGLQGQALGRLVID